MSHETIAGMYERFFCKYMEEEKGPQLVPATRTTKKG